LDEKGQRLLDHITSLVDTLHTIQGYSYFDVILDLYSVMPEAMEFIAMVEARNAATP